MREMFDFTCSCGYEMGGEIDDENPTDRLHCECGRIWSVGLAQDSDEEA